ncbi:hypothetical protein D8780_10765 [Notoacmeibacter ruber]|uniref:Uncharacterized protein n=1 Tax=Notoacmeibacter ruber TaxID=2670375 RepID=A0A3L7JG79_9HYPH|nr:hypothetical protein D8780_10765 [Notoacmeibacter ruber]
MAEGQKTNTPLFRPIGVNEQAVVDADFEIISPTGECGPALPVRTAKNETGFAVLLILIIVGAFLFSGGWSVFRI